MLILSNYNTMEPHCDQVEQTGDFTLKYQSIQVNRVKLDYKQFSTGYLFLLRGIHGNDLYEIVITMVHCVFYQIQLYCYYYFFSIWLRINWQSFW